MLGVSDGESSDSVDNSLTFGLLWLEHVRQSSRRGAVAGLRLIVLKDFGPIRVDEVHHHVTGLHGHATRIVGTEEDRQLRWELRELLAELSKRRKSSNSGL